MPSSTLLDTLSRRLFLALADSRTLKHLASRYGMRGRRGVARRFIGGRNVSEAIDTARQLEQQGLLHTFNYWASTSAVGKLPKRPRSPICG